MLDRQLEGELEDDIEETEYDDGSLPQDHRGSLQGNDDQDSLTTSGKKRVTYADHAENATDSPLLGDDHRPFLTRTLGPLTPGSLRGSILALSASAIGAGMLSLPLVLYNCGLVVGLVLLIIGALLALFSIELLVECGHTTKVKNYSGLVEHMYGKRWAQVIEAIIVFYAFGASVAYLIVIGKSAHSVLSTLPVSPDSILNNQNAVLAILTAVLCFPLSLLRNLSSLRYASIFSIMAMLYVSVSIFVRSFEYADFSGIAFAKPTWRLPQSITITFFAYTAHVNVFSIYSELQNPLVRRMQKVTRRAVTLETLLYMLIAVSGFLSWQNASTMECADLPSHSWHNGTEVNTTTTGNCTLVHETFQGNILDAYPSNDQMILAGRVAVSFALSIAFPLNIHPCRLNLENLVFPSRDFSWVRHIVLTALLVGPALGLAIAIPQVNLVFGLLGATCSVIFCFILPILLYVKIHYDQLSSQKRMSLYALLGLIIMIGLASVAESIYDFTQ